MKDSRIDGRRAFVETYRKIRKKMPPTEKVIPNEKDIKKDDKFDWRKELDNDDDYKSIKDQRGY